VLLQQALNSLVLGSMYSIVALGFTLYFGMVNLINFAHGDLCALGAFVFLLVSSFLSGHAVSASALYFGVAAIASIVLCTVTGLLSERFLFRPVRRGHPLEGLIISIAFSMVIREAILRFYPNGGNPQQFPDPFRQQSVQLFGVGVSYSQVFLMSVCVLSAVLFYCIVAQTHFGRTMRALSQDSEAAIMIGLPVNRTIIGAFALGAILAAVAGILNGSVYGSVKFDMGLSLGVKGFVAAVVGGLDNPNGAIIGGMLLAFLETSAISFVPGGSAYRDIIAFCLLLAVLLIRPAGLLMRNSRPSA